MRLPRILFAVLAATGLTLALTTAPAGATPAPRTTTYTVTQCMTDFNVDFWDTGAMLHGQGTIVFDVYRYDGHGWVYFGENTDTIWGLENQVNYANPMHGTVMFSSTIGDFTGTWSAGSVSEGISGVGQIMARSTDGTMKLQTPKQGVLDAAQYPPKCDSTVSAWVVTSH